MLTIPNIEQQPLPAIKKFQEEKLMELLAYLKKNSLFYQNLFKAHQINIDNVR
ncbi:MAG: phenylacetate--CoA ligase, partial [Flavobacteriales bacterium]